MRSAKPHHFPLLALAFYLLIWVAEARGRGGSSGSSEDSSGSSGNDDSSSSEGSTSCVNSGRLLITDLDVIRFDNFSSNPNYGGAYFFGEASLKSVVEQGNKSTCTPTNGGTLPNRLLAAAFIAPQSPWPQGPKNSIVIGFKGWATDKSLKDIMTSYNDCKVNADTIFFRTTSWFTYTYPDNELHGARDSVPLTLSAGNKTIDFRGNYIGGPQTTWSNISNAQWTDDEISFSDGFCSGYPGSVEPVPIGAIINGSFSSEIFTLTVTGIVNSVISGVNVSFTLDFEGAFASANSTQTITTGRNGDSIVSFAVINSTQSGYDQGRLRAFGPTIICSIGVALILTYGCI